MPGVSGAPKHYFVEKDRVASFKSWPFTERHDCSITKVGYILYFLMIYPFSREFR